MSKVLIILIKFYQYIISPFLGNRCRFMPTCSEYFIEALNYHGFLKGLNLGIRRIIKCHPFKFLGAKSGIDFVPIPKNKSRLDRINIIISGLKKIGWKFEEIRKNKNG